MESSPLSAQVAVSPVQPPAGYVGGKRNSARRIVEHIERVPHDAYFEPCVGMGGIFLRRRFRPRIEAVNDISGDVATFFRVLQEHYPYFMDMLRWRLASRAEFNRLLDQSPETLTDLQRAARFLYLQRLGFGGKVSGRTYGVDRHQGARFNVNKLEPLLADIHDRLAGVTIEQLPYPDFISRYDQDGALFYLDPPYHGCEADYGRGVFERDDFGRMAEQLSAIKGAFLLSINDTPDIRSIFGAFAMIDMPTTYSLSTIHGAKSARELLISSRPLE